MILNDTFQSYYQTHIEKHWSHTRKAHRQLQKHFFIFSRRQSAIFREEAWKSNVERKAGRETWVCRLRGILTSHYRMNEKSRLSNLRKDLEGLQVTFTLDGQSLDFLKSFGLLKDNSTRMMVSQSFTILFFNFKSFYSF